MMQGKDIKKLQGLQDARSTRGIMARGYAKYGISNAPKPGKLTNVQRAAKMKLKKLHEKRM